MTYVNYRGEEIGLIVHDVPKKAKKVRDEKAGWHNGWRVQGVPPGALEEAKGDFARRCKPWDEEVWLRNAARKPVRSKPYAVPEAARECARLAESAGWLRVEVVELKQEASAAASMF